MITKKTVLILGAGASCPYGLPTGFELLRRVVATLEHEEYELVQTLIRYGFATDFSQLAHFRENLIRSGALSVDAFLEHRPRDEELGKAIIAASLISDEKESEIFRWIDVRRWYEHLFKQMDARKDQFHQNNLTVVTFNYDRSLEYFLFHALRSKYEDTDEEDASELVSTVKIIHVHGQLGKPHFWGAGGRPYNPELSREAISQCIPEIKIIHDTDTPEPSDEFEEAHQEIREAEALCFFGFGYHPTNLKHLGIDKKLLEALRTSGCHIRGTLSGLTLSKKEAVRELFGRIMDANETSGEKVFAQETILEFLEKRRVFT